MGRSWLTSSLLFFMLLVVSHQKTQQDTEIQQGLTCVNDYNKNVSCMWNASNQPDNGNCTLHGTINQVESNCKLKPLNAPDQSFKACYFILQKTVSFYSIVNITIKCDGKAFSNIMHYMPKDHIKLHPPGILNCTAGNVTWSQGTQLTLLITEYEFELQVTKPDKKVTLIPTQQQWMAINSTTLQKESTSSNNIISLMLGVAIFVLINVILAVIWKSIKGHCYLRKKDQQMLDLSKDSQGLHSLQFQEWLSPYFTPESFAASVSRDDISPVEVCPAYNTDPYFSCTTKALLYPNDKENINDCRSNGELSGFSNVGYFSEYRPGSIQIYSCPNYFTYHDHRGHQTRDEKGHHSPTGSSSYEQLEHLEKCGHLNSQWLEPLSPDSGVGMEDREEGGHGAPPSAQLEPMWEAAATHISGRLASTTVQPSSSGYLTVKQMQSTYNKSI
ncbi:interleukin-2 receptor subunit beta isoform X2 [Denticeps clupeoides]|uniref:interleukin-2 receptor subunit beta isoform X2 n=1 Tax=Denticeps clupeoides TaxID=299321 RepID=UPI0010A3D34D|nr:interleukin-2 receptor subunit beta-like isoform X2 [Denticeps clupeoides]